MSIVIRGGPTVAASKLARARDKVGTAPVRTNTTTCGSFHSGKSAVIFAASSFNRHSVPPLATGTCETRSPEG